MQLRLITYEDAVDQAGGNADEVEKSWLLHELKNSQEVQAELKQAIFSKVATIRAKNIQATGIPVTELAGVGPPTMGPGGAPMVPGATGVPGGTPGVGNPRQLGCMPPQPVPAPGMGLPIAPPPPPGAGGMMPPGGIPGGPVVPGPPANYVGP